MPVCNCENIWVDIAMILCPRKCVNIMYCICSKLTIDSCVLSNTNLIKCDIFIYTTLCVCASVYVKHMCMCVRACECIYAVVGACVYACTLEHYLVVAFCLQFTTRSIQTPRKHMVHTLEHIIVKNMNNTQHTI
jgi:hypothetical protein